MGTPSGTNWSHPGCGWQQKKHGKTVTKQLMFIDMSLCQKKSTQKFSHTCRVVKNRLFGGRCVIASWHCLSCKVLFHNHSAMQLFSVAKGSAPKSYQGLSVGSGNAQLAEPVCEPQAMTSKKTNTKDFTTFNKVQCSLGTLQIAWQLVLLVSPRHPQSLSLQCALDF